MKSHAMAISVAVLVLGGCATTGEDATVTTRCTAGDVMAPPPDLYPRRGCSNTQTYLSVVFDQNDNPIGIGGGDSSGFPDPSDKHVNKDRGICWVGLKCVNDTVTAANVAFDLWFDPKKPPNPGTKTSRYVKIPKRTPSGVAFKYTVWTNASDPDQPATYKDPRIVIN